MRSHVRMLYAFAFVMNSATGVLVVALPLLAIRLGAGPLGLGMLGAISSLVYAMACPLAGRHSDGAGPAPPVSGVARRRSLMLSCALLVGVDSCIFLVARLQDLFIMAVSGSLCAAFFWPPLQAWLAETGPNPRLPDRLGMFNLSWSLGIMVGPMIGGELYALDYRYPWCYAIATNFVMFVIMAAMRRQLLGPPEGGGEHGGAARDRAEDAAAAKRAGIFLFLGLWANFICWFALGMVQSIYPKLAVARGLSPQLIGYLLFMVGVAQSLFFVALRASSFWHFRYAPLVAVHAAAGAGMLLIFSKESVPLLTCAFALLGIGCGLSYYSSIYYSLFGAESRGQRTGIHEFMVGSAFLFGPLSGGIIARYAGLRAPFLVCALILFGTASVEAFLWFSSRGGAAGNGQE